MAYKFLIFLLVNYFPFFYGINEKADSVVTQKSFRQPCEVVQDTLSFSTAFSVNPTQFYRYRPDGKPGRELH